MATVSLSKTLKSKSYISNEIGFSTKRYSFFNYPGDYSWSIIKGPDGKHLPAHINIELCASGGGGASGFLKKSPDGNKEGLIGGAGGSSGTKITKNFYSYEIDDQMVIKVGSAGIGGISTPLTPDLGDLVPNTEGTDGHESFVRILNSKEIVIKTKPGKGGKHIGTFPNHMSVSETYAGPAVYDTYEDNSGEITPYNNFGGAGGAGYAKQDSNIVLRDAGLSDGGGNGGSLVVDGYGRSIGLNGQCAGDYGSGGGGGGATLLVPEITDIKMAGNGANGKCGYVKILSVFTI